MDELVKYRCDSPSNSNPSSTESPLSTLTKQPSKTSSKCEHTEELIYFSQLYHICAGIKTKNCLNAKLQQDVFKKFQQYKKAATRLNIRRPHMRHIYEYNFVEIYLNDVCLKNGVPEEIFLCRNVRILSLRGNHLRSISPNIGRLSKLEALELTDNNLNTQDLPFTLTFCQYLHTLYLDNNKMFALPGFLLRMENLETIRRLSSKCTLRDIFDVNIHRRSVRIERVLNRRNTHAQGVVETLEKMAARCIAANKLNYFAKNELPILMQNRISRYYPEFTICENCDVPTRGDGFLLYTFRLGHLGNYWSAFTHRACSKCCAEEIDMKARVIEMESVNEATMAYSAYVESYNNTSCDATFHSTGCCTIS